MLPGYATFEGSISTISLVLFINALRGDSDVMVASFPFGMRNMRPTKMLGTLKLSALSFMAKAMAKDDLVLPVPMSWNIKRSL